MNTLPLHPKFVHLPIALSVLIPLIAVAILIAWWRGHLPRRAWWGVIALQALLLGSGLVARSTGEGDEERVERLVPEAALEAHEEAATTFLIATGLALAVMIGAAVVRAAAPARGVALAGVGAAAIVLWFGLRVGQAGGELVYQHGAAAAFTGGATTGGGAPPAAAPSAAAEDDDD